MKNSVALFAAAAVVVMLGVVYATAQMPIPKPAPELAKLDFLAGHWVMEGDMKPGPMGPGGKMTSTGESRWVEGKFFMVENAKFSGANFEGTTLAVIGYDPEKKVYTYNEFNSMGEATQSTGTVDGDTWTWTSEENMGGQMMKGRYSMKVLSPTEYTFKFELSKDGTNWTPAMDGKATKK